MDEGAAPERWRDDGVVLAQIGAALDVQTTEIEVRVPRALADLAVASWQRDEADAEQSDESAEETTIRHRAGALALIGLALEDRGREDGDDVIVRLDALFIGDALHAADEAGLLDF